MKTKSILRVILSAWFVLSVFAVLATDEKGKNEIIEYEVLSIDQQNWIVSAKEVGTENEIKFRMPPEIFKGQTFDADFANGKLGQRFSIRGSKNAKLNNLIMERPIIKGKTRFMRSIANNETVPAPDGGLGWQIENVDSKNWIVTSRNRFTNQVVQLQVHPDSFIGFRFKADLRSIQRGQGFSIFTPNELPMNNCCTLLKLKVEENK